MLSFLPTHPILPLLLTFTSTFPLPLFAAPPIPPRITYLTTSGPGCPSSTSSLTPSSSTLSDTFGLTFTQLKSSSTTNCAVHISSSGASPGWQVSVRQVEYSGNVVLKGKSGLEAFTTVFWSERAGDTAILTTSLTCPNPPNDTMNQLITLRSTSSTADLKWSECTSMAEQGDPGILNVNFRPVVQGEFGEYDFRAAKWVLEWRRC